MDVSRVRDLGWQPAIQLEDGLAETYEWFVEREGAYRQS